MVCVVCACVCVCARALSLSLSHHTFALTHFWLHSAASTSGTESGRLTNRLTNRLTRSTRDRATSEGGVCGNGEVSKYFIAPQYSPLEGGEGVRGGEDPESSGGLRDGRGEEGFVGREVW